VLVRMQTKCEYVMSAFESKNLNSLLEGSLLFFLDRVIRNFYY
jgi:hypothetical protein